MAYRDDRSALETRRAALEGELSALKARKDELLALASREEELARDLERTRELLSRLGETAPRGPSLLEDVRIASPCKANWDDMAGDERARFCGQCAKNVYNLSAMTHDEAEAFLRLQTSEVCVRLYRRADGTVMTSDCSVGVRRKRRRHLAVIAAGGALMSAAAMSLTSTMGSRHAMGAVAVQGGMEPMADAPILTQPVGAAVMGTAAPPLTPPPAPPHKFATPPKTRRR